MSTAVCCRAFKFSARAGDPQRAEHSKAVAPAMSMTFRLIMLLPRSNPARCETLVMAQVSAARSGDPRLVSPEFRRMVLCARSPVEEDAVPEIGAHPHYRFAADGFKMRCVIAHRAN